MKLTDPITLDQIKDVQEHLKIRNNKEIIQGYCDLYGTKYKTIDSRIRSIKTNRKQSAEKFFPILHFIRTGEKLEFETTKPVKKKETEKINKTTKKEKDSAYINDIEKIKTCCPFYDNLDFQKAYIEFREHRVQVKAKLTNKAEVLILNKLGKETPETAILMIEQSIEKGYKGVFKPNNQYQKPQREKYGTLETNYLEGL